MNLQPGDRFRLMGIRLIVERRPWWPWLRWLQRLAERLWPAIPKGSLLELHINGRPYLHIPVSGTAVLAMGCPDRMLKIGPRDDMRCEIRFPSSRPLKAMRGIRVMLDGVLVRGDDELAVSFNPEGT